MFKEIIEQIDQAMKVYVSSMSWENKYEFIFGMKIHKKIREANLTFDWLDPDASYEQDVEAYIDALIDIREQLESV